MEKNVTTIWLPNFGQSSCQMFLKYRKVLWSYKKDKHVLSFDTKIKQFHAID